MMSSTFSSPRSSRSTSHEPLSPTSSSSPSIPANRPYPPLPLSSSPLPSLHPPTATLIVGGPTSPSREPYPTKFVVPIHLLTSCSPFFAACLGSSATGISTSIWTEARTGVIHLPTERVEDVAMLVRWLEGETGVLDVDVDVDVGALGNDGDVDGNGNGGGIGDTGLKLWRELCHVQPGLRHEAIDGAVEEYLNWKCEKLRRKAVKKERKSVEQGQVQKQKQKQKRETRNKAVEGVCCGLVDDDDAVDYLQVTAGCENDMSDSILEAVGIEQGETKPTLKVTTSTSGHSIQSHALRIAPSPSPPPRPPPPILGPLIRLYILADKYDISYPSTYLSSPPSPADIRRDPAFNATLPLRHALTLRLKTIYTLTHTVPHQEDIVRLWNFVPVDVLGEEGMKAEIVKMFVGIREREVGRVLGGENWGAEFLRSVLIGRAEREVEMEKEREKRREVKVVKQGRSQ